MPAGLGGANHVFIALESVMGTLVDPAGTGVWCPILSEDLEYNEDKYYSPQIRETTIVSDVQSSYYHVEGTIRMEVDVNYIPYFLHASRHTITKTGAVAPFVYKYTPSNAGSASTAASGNVARTLSISIIRNGIGFGYAGCVVNTYEETVENGVLIATMGILGLSETDLGSLGTTSWISPSLFGADAHSIYVDASGTAPAFAGANDVTFNGWTYRYNYNATPQNRIVPSRSATYIAFGETESSYETELDFLSKTEYNNMKNNTTRALRRESLKGGASFAAATQAHRVTINRTSYENYAVGTPSIGDLVMARVTGRNVGIAGGDAYSIEVKSPVNIA